MRRLVKQFSGLIYIVALTVIVMVVLISSNEMPRVLDALGRLDVAWVWASAGFIALYLIARAVTIKFYLWRERLYISPLNALLVTGIGQFYSAITPSASGGQPLQVLAMCRMGIPLSAATATVSVKFIGFQAALLPLGGLLWLLHPGVVSDQLGKFQWLVALGYVVNLALVALVIMTMRKNRAVERFVDWVTHLSARMHRDKDEAGRKAKAHAALSEYRDALKRLMEKPLEALIVFALSMVQILTLMVVTVCLYRAFGQTGFSAGELLTLAVLLFITAAFVPLPGAAGAQEGGFYLFFRGVFPESGLLAAMLSWRFFTYYLLLLTGLLGVIADGVLNAWRKRHDV